MTGTAWEGECSALEERAEVESLFSLQAQRRQLMREYATLRALHGPGGKWDARRKQLLEATKVKVRMEARARDEKVTDASVDALAHADERYAQVIDEGIAGATRYIELENEISEIAERIENRSSSLYAYSAEARLSR